MPTRYVTEGGIVGPAMRQIEGIKQAKARTTLEELAAAEAPGNYARQKTIQELAISKGQEEATNLPIQRKRETEKYDMGQMTGWLNLAMASMPHVRNAQDYQDWYEYMQEKGVPPQLLGPNLPADMPQKDFDKYKEDLLNQGMQAQLKLEEFRQQGQQNLEAQRQKGNERIAEITAGSRRDFDELSAKERAIILTGAYPEYQARNMMPDPESTDKDNPKWIKRPGAPPYDDKWRKDYFDEIRGAAENKGAPDWRQYTGGGGYTGRGGK